LEWLHITKLDKFDCLDNFSANTTQNSTSPWLQNVTSWHCHSYKVCQLHSLTVTQIAFYSVLVLLFPLQQLAERVIKLLAKTNIYEDRNCLRLPDILCRLNWYQSQALNKALKFHNKLLACIKMLRTILCSILCSPY